MPLEKHHAWVMKGEETGDRAALFVDQTAHFAGMILHAG